MQKNDKSQFKMNYLSLFNVYVVFTVWLFGHFRVVMAKLKEISPKMVQYVKSVKVKIC